MTLVQYDPFDQEKIVVNEQIILEYYRSEGYPGVRVKSRVEDVESSLESEGKKFRVVFEMEEKPRVYLSDIYISGTKFYSELDIKRFILSSEIDCVAWQINQAFSVKK